MANSNEYMRDYMLRRYHKRRNEALERLGGVCVFCGSSERLEFDHIDPAMKLGDIAKLWSYSYRRFLEELELCQLLCRRCHIDKTKIDLGVAHGGGVSGKYVSIDGRRRGCPCDLCTPIRNTYNRDRRQNTRQKNK